MYKNDNYDKNIVHLGYAPAAIENNGICEQNIENIQNVYTNLSAPKKRKLSQDSPLVKSEPGILICYDILTFLTYFLQNIAQQVNLAHQIN